MTTKNLFPAPAATITFLIPNAAALNPLFILPKIYLPKAC